MPGSKRLLELFAQWLVISSHKRINGLFLPLSLLRFPGAGKLLKCSQVETQAKENILRVHTLLSNQMHLPLLHKVHL